MYALPFVISLSFLMILIALVISFANGIPRSLVLLDTLTTFTGIAIAVFVWLAVLYFFNIPINQSFSDFFTNFVWWYPFAIVLPAIILSIIGPIIPQRQNSHQEDEDYVE